MTAVTKTPVQVTLTTPRRLKAVLAALLAATGIFWLAAESEISRVRASVQTIGKDSVPSIVAAEDIRVLLARANVHAIQATAGPPADAQEAWRLHDLDMAAAADRLVTAAQNITYGDDERVPILKILDGMNVYAREVGVARAESGVRARAHLRDATRILRGDVLTQAEALDHANFAHLDSEYARAQSSASGGLVGAGLALIVTFAAAQIWLARRFRRVLSLPIAIGMLVILGVFMQELLLLGRSRELMKVAKADAFDSIHALSRARATAFDAASDEAFYLLDGAAEDEQAFEQRCSALAYGSLDDATLRSIACGGRGGLSGYIADELANITFEGEREQALAMARSWRAVTVAHQEACEVVRHGKAPVVAIRCGPASTLGSAFEEFDGALVATLKTNQSAFDRAVGDAVTELDGLPGPLAFASVLLALLSWLGVRARLREYAE